MLLLLDENSLGIIYVDTKPEKYLRAIKRSGTTSSIEKFKNDHMKLTENVRLTSNFFKEMYAYLELLNCSKIQLHRHSEIDSKNFI